MNVSYTNPYEVGYSAGLTGMDKDIPTDETEAEEYREGYSHGERDRGQCFTDPIPNNVESQLLLRYPAL